VAPQLAVSQDGLIPLELVSLIDPIFYILCLRAPCILYREPYARKFLFVNMIPDKAISAHVVCSK
jgi:hypothetical protein